MADIRALARRRRRIDKAFSVFGLVCTLSGIAVLGLLLLDLVSAGLSRIDWRFLTSFPSSDAGKAGIVAALVGSLLVIVVTASLAIVLGVAAGVYLEEYAKKSWVGSFIEINIANLASVPSIIYGLLGLGMLVYVFRLERTILVGGITLAVLIFPIVIVATREALRSIPQHIREAAYAMGATKWQVTRHHLLPYSSGGIATGVIIGLSRALGETAPLVTIGALAYIDFLPESPLDEEFPFVNFEWLDSPFTVLPIQMFNWVSLPGDDFRVNAAATGLVLILLTLTLNSFAIVIRYRMRRNIKW